MGTFKGCIVRFPPAVYMVLILSITVVIAIAVTGKLTERRTPGSDQGLTVEQLQHEGSEGGKTSSSYGIKGPQ